MRYFVQKRGDNPESLSITGRCLNAVSTDDLSYSLDEASKLFATAQAETEWKQNDFRIIDTTEKVIIQT